MLAFPRATRQEDVDALAKRALEVLQFCRAERWAERDHMRVELSADARKRYEELYLGELNDNSAGERITALIERRAPMLLRLAMLFALCDLTDTVDVQHINAALAWVRYSVESVKFVFASAADEVEVAETNDTAQKIADFLRVNGQATRSELTTICFKGHAPKSRIDAALDELLKANPPAICVESVARPKGSPGTATKIYRLTGANSAKSANSEDPCGFASNYPESELSKICELSPKNAATVRTVSRIRNPENPAETRTSIDVSHSSNSSQGIPENPANDEDAEVF
jgi:hypothetical protein